MKKHFLTLMALILLCGCSSDLVQKTSVCDLVTNPAKYDSKLVRVTGFAGMTQHGAALRDSSCPDYMIYVDTSSKEVGPSEFYSSLGGALVSDVPDANVTLFGRFNFYPKRYPAHVLFVTELKVIPAGNSAPKDGA